ncbi:hypothetical protein [Chitinophaga japonensis]|uniref:hypothetical protein n=1 Tax=Chitinophaga japonensis TaxID=104662 RepID=UPI0011A86394|nr:hypothetical protein [Chitinophaga japonensis]
MKYDILTAVFYRHSFFPGHGYEGISIRVPAHTAESLLQHGLILKLRQDGFLLLYDAMPAGRSRTRDTLLQEKIRLDFDLVLNDELFYNYTQVAVSNLAGSLFYFSNAQQRAVPVALHKEEQVTAQDLRPLAELAETFFVKPFGRLELLLDEHLLPAYHISFSAKATRWCYFLVGKELRELARPAVIGTNGNGHFDMPVMISLPGNETVPVLISKNALPLAREPVQTFQLVDYSTLDTTRYKVVIAALPAPEIGRVSNAAAALYEQGNEYSEIFLY